MSKVMGDVAALRTEVQSIQRKQALTESHLKASEEASKLASDALAREQAVNYRLKNIIKLCLEVNGKKRLSRDLETSIRQDAPELLWVLDGDTFRTGGVNYF